MARAKTVETRRKEPRADRGGRQYVAVHRNYLGLETRLQDGGGHIAAVFQYENGELTRRSQATFLRAKNARAWVRDHVGRGRMRAAMTPEQHAARLGWVAREPEGIAAYRRHIEQRPLKPTMSHKVAVKFNLYVDDVDLEAVAARGFSDRRRAKLSEVKRWAEVTLLGQLQLARERRSAELEGERTGR